MENLNARTLCRVIALWSVLTFAAGLGAILYAEADRQAEMEAAWRRAETQVATAEQSLLTSYDAVRNAMQLLLLRQTLIEYGDRPGVRQLELVLNDLAHEARLGVVLVSVADLSGRVIWSSNQDMVGLDVSRRSYFTELTDGSGRVASVSPPQMSLISERWRVHVARSIPDSQGNTVGIAVVSVDPLALSEALMRQVAQPGQSIVVNRLADGAVRAISWDAEARLARAAQPDHPVMQAAQAAERGRIVFDTPGDERRVMAAWQVAPGVDMVVSARFDIAGEVAAHNRLVVMLSLATGLFSVAILALGLAWARGVALHRRLAREAGHDPLTGLRNRRSLEAQMAGRAPPYAALLFDLDHFKSVNDRYGHDMGDRVLRDVAQALQEAVRHEDLVCRWGGEEMLVVLSRCTLAEAAPRAEVLRQAIAAIYRDRGEAIGAITASIGVACAPLHGDDLAALVPAADAALYRAKAAGRNRVAMAEA